MGYDLHITRAADWAESDSRPITLDEWRRYVASDREMHMQRIAEVTCPDGSILRYESEGLAVWVPRSHPAEERVWFDWRRGQIAVNTPDDEVVRKMVCIAGALNARVQGDDGEYYGEDEAPGDYDSTQPSPDPAKPWWKRRFGV